MITHIDIFYAVLSHKKITNSVFLSVCLFICLLFVCLFVIITIIYLCSSLMLRLVKLFQLEVLATSNVEERQGTDFLTFYPHELEDTDSFGTGGKRQETKSIPHGLKIKTRDIRMFSCIRK